jgi:hypothetical protein
MTARLEDRRHRRSHDPLVALHYQLTSARKEGALDTIVVADGEGVVVAGAGSWAACEELAAFAPLIARGERASESCVNVRSVDIGGDRVLLCTRSAQQTEELAIVREAAIRRAAVGISRILQAA